MTRTPIVEPGPELWRALDFPRIDDEIDGLRPYVERLKDAYANGAVIHRTFGFPEEPELRKRVSLAFDRDPSFFRHFWHCPSVKAALPYELHAPEFAESEAGPGHPFRWSSTVELPGQLGNALWAASTYSLEKLDARGALAWGMTAAEALLEGRFDWTWVLSSRKPWSQFFHGVAWDYTWILVEPARGRIVVLMATDKV